MTVNCTVPVGESVKSAGAAEEPAGSAPPVTPKTKKSRPESKVEANQPMEVLVALSADVTAHRLIRWCIWYCRPTFKSSSGAIVGELSLTATALAVSEIAPFLAISILYTQHTLAAHVKQPKCVDAIPLGSCCRAWAQLQLAA